MNDKHINDTNIKDKHINIFLHPNDNERKMEHHLSKYTYTYIFIYIYIYTHDPTRNCVGMSLHLSMLQCVAACCSVLCCVAVCCSVLQSYAGVSLHLSMLQYVVVCCSVLQCVAKLCWRVSCSITAATIWEFTCTHVQWYGVATMSRFPKIIGLFCRILSLLQRSFAKETYNFK